MTYRSAFRFLAMRELMIGRLSPISFLPRCRRWLLPECSAIVAFRLPRALQKSFAVLHTFHVTAPLHQRMGDAEAPAVGEAMAAELGGDAISTTTAIFAERKLASLARAHEAHLTRVDFFRLPPQRMDCQLVYLKPLDF